MQTRTLWGELALQLGRVELYKLIEANDQSRAVPQGLFAEILRKAAPCLILLESYRLTIQITRRTTASGRPSATSASRLFPSSM